MVRSLAMSPQLYWTLLALTCAYAWVRGGSDERVIAVVCLLASVVTAFVLAPWGQRYSHVEAGEMMVDLGVLAAFVMVAVRSDRFWPLWVAGLQLTSSLAHLMKGINFELLPQAYAAATKIWSYPILLIIIVGTWRHQHNARRGQHSRAA
jgi:hypothetical protein